jgi:hypothetical protein
MTHREQGRWASSRILAVVCILLDEQRDGREQMQAAKKKGGGLEEAREILEAITAGQDSWWWCRAELPASGNQVGQCGGRGPSGARLAGH